MVMFTFLLSALMLTTVHSQETEETITYTVKFNIKERSIWYVKKILLKTAIM